MRILTPKMQEITKCFIISNVKTHNRHHVKLHGHGDDIKADDSRDCQVEVFRGDHFVDDQASGAVVHVIWTL